MNAGFIAGRSAAGRTLTIRDAQHEYVYVEDPKPVAAATTPKG